jgi:hypothetical protein
MNVQDEAESTHLVGIVSAGDLLGAYTMAED